MTPPDPIIPDIDIVYPESDGLPMGENSIQIRWIMKIVANLQILFGHRDDVFVAGDMFWYPVQGQPAVVTAPDAMVVFGRPTGDRSSYLQWREDDVAPQVVFEVLSPSNTEREMAKKLEWYECYGVQEYYIYDPDDMPHRLQVYIRRENALIEIENVDGYISPLLGIRFVLGEEEMQVFAPDGRQFLTPLEMDAEHRREMALLEEARDNERERAELAAASTEEMREMRVEADRKRKAEMRRRREAERNAAEQLRLRAEAEARSRKAEADMARLLEQLRLAGVDPRSLPRPPEV